MSDNKTKKIEESQKSNSGEKLEETKLIKSELKGRVHSIQSFGTVDGPGLRTVIFFQGCPLKCKFCHNIDMGDGRLGKEYNVQELFKEVMKYKEYWMEEKTEERTEVRIEDLILNEKGGKRKENLKKIKGGVTFSGGEPTFQFEFVAQLAKKLKEAGVHTSIDTCFGTAQSVVDKLYPHIDYWMVSVKHLIKEEHLKLTGVLNTHILQNIEHLDKNLAESEDKRLRIRFLVIPGITDTPDHLALLAEFLKKLKCLDFVEVLPYGTHGKFKWVELFGSYPLEGVPDATKDDINKVKQFLEEYGIRTFA